MPAGQLRDRLRFESPTPQQDDYGNEIEGWTAEFTEWAHVKPLKGSETVMAARLSGSQPVAITVRRSTRTRRITTDWRAVHTHDGTVYQIKSPPADMSGKRMYLDMVAEVGVAG